VRRKIKTLQFWKPDNFSSIFAFFYCINLFIINALFYSLNSFLYSFPRWRCDLIPGHGLSLRGYAITLIRHTTIGSAPLDEWSARRRDLYLSTHNTHKRQQSIPSAVFEPAIPASEWLQTHALFLTATGIERLTVSLLIILLSLQLMSSG
jgi:hypothetical protein